ncbi:MAG: HNH endonuclease [Cyclobacteriaceae bacterium]
MDYRKAYKNYYGEYPNDCEIHHMDHDINNNDVSNLVCITKELHKKYHSVYMGIPGINTLDISPKNAMHIFSGAAYGDLIKYLTLLSRISQIKADQIQAVKYDGLKKYLSYE